MRLFGKPAIGFAAALVTLWMALIAFPACAREAAPLAEDEAVEKRLVVISEEMRCLVCQNESLAGSHADLAVSLRAEIRNMIKAGKSDQEITQFMVDRYGDFVLYRPPVKGSTALLWFGPALLLMVGLFVLIRYLRQRNLKIRDADLSADELARAEALLKEKDQK